MIASLLSNPRFSGNNHNIGLDGFDSSSDFQFLYLTTICITHMFHIFLFIPVWVQISVYLFALLSICTIPSRSPFPPNHAKSFTPVVLVFCILLLSSSSMSLDKLHMLSFCVLSILALISLTLMALFSFLFTITRFGRL